jgi:hypothetical protein
MNEESKFNLLRRLLRVPGIPSLWLRLGLGSFTTRLRFDMLERPHYAYGLYSAASMAKTLGVPTIAAVEFGVAGGMGLLALERLADAIEHEVGVSIQVFGFDSGAGMPPPVDYRDLPHVWGQGFYVMDVDALKRRLTRAKLFLGDVAATVPKALDSGLPPLGFVAFDLDYYSSTMAAFRLFDGPHAMRLPRVYCYFDDVIGPDFACMNEHVGELLAIHEFNDSHPKQKISPIVNFSTLRERPATWNVKMYAHHDFEHPLYAKNLVARDDPSRQLPLR